MVGAFRSRPAGKRILRYTLQCKPWLDWKSLLHVQVV